MYGVSSSCVYATMYAMVMMMMMMVYYYLSKKTPLLNTHAFTPVESELNTLSAALAAPKLHLKIKPLYVSDILHLLSDF